MKFQQSSRCCNRTNVVTKASSQGYNMTQIYKKALKDKKIDCLDYFGSVQVQTLENNKQRGLVATESIGPGTLLFSETALSYSSIKSKQIFKGDDEISIEEVDYGTQYLEAEKMTKVSISQLQHRVRLHLYDNLIAIINKDSNKRKHIAMIASALYNPSDEPIPLLPTVLNQSTGNSFLDSAERSQTIDAHQTDQNNLNELTSVINWLNDEMNIFIDKYAIGKTFLSENHTLNGACAGIWPVASMMNHACQGNVVLQQVNNKLFVRSTRKIQEGEEIVFPYIPQLSSNTVLQKYKNRWGFVCQCQTCHPLQKDPNIFTQRQNILNNYTNNQISGEEAIQKLRKLGEACNPQLLSVITDEYARAADQNDPKLAAKYLQQKFRYNLHHGMPECVGVAVQLASVNYSMADEEAATEWYRRAVTLCEQYYGGDEEFLEWFILGEGGAWV